MDGKIEDVIQEDLPVGIEVDDDGDECETCAI